MRWVERQTDCRLKRIVLDGRMEYFTEMKDPEADGIEVCVTASYVPEEITREKRMNRTIKNSIRTMLVHSRDPARL